MAQKGINHIAFVNEGFQVSRPSVGISRESLLERFALGTFAWDLSPETFRVLRWV